MVRKARNSGCDWFIQLSDNRCLNNNILLSDTNNNNNNNTSNNNNNNNNNNNSNNNNNNNNVFKVPKEKLGTQVVIGLFNCPITGV